MKLSTEVKAEILDSFKSEGLEIAEDTAVAATRAVFNIMRKVVPKVSFGLGGIINPLLNIVEPKVLAILDHIDGKDDPNI